MAKELKQRRFYKEHIHKYWEEGTEQPVLVGSFLEKATVAAAVVVIHMKVIGVVVEFHMKDCQRQVGMVYCMDTDKLSSSYKQLVKE